MTDNGVTKNLPFCLDIFDAGLVSWNPQSHLAREWFATREAAVRGAHQWEAIPSA